MNNIYEDKDILVTGGCGSIGSELVKKLLEFNPKKIRVFDNNESGHFHLNQKINSNKIRNLIGDVRDRNRVFRALSGVDIVFHAAALKHVPFCEYDPFEAVSTNVIGTKNLVEGSINNNVERFIGISTDKAVNPINTMGATKLLSEKIIINAPVGLSQTIFSCVRFGNVLDSVGSVTHVFKDQIKNGGPVTLTSKNMTRFCMRLSDAIDLILKAANLMKTDLIKEGEIFILKMKALRIIDLADVLIKELAPRYNYDPKQIKIKIVGPRPGEKINELLMTEYEAQYAEDLGDMFVLRPRVSIPHLTYPDTLPGSNMNLKKYDSGKAKLLTKDEIRDLLYKEKIL
jgi:FlaA1/EpsC-like NDP-sugar epimerase